MLQGAARVDTHGRYLNADDTYVRSFGHPSTDLIGSDWKSIIHPEDIAEAMRAYREMQVSDFGEFTSHGFTASRVGLSMRVLLIKDYDRQKAFSGHFCFFPAWAKRRSTRKALSKCPEDLLPLRPRFLIN